MASGCLPADDPRFLLAVDALVMAIGIESSTQSTDHGGNRCGTGCAASRTLQQRQLLQMRQYFAAGWRQIVDQLHQLDDDALALSMINVVPVEHGAPHRPLG